MDWCVRHDAKYYKTVSGVNQIIILYCKVCPEVLICWFSNPPPIIEIVRSVAMLSSVDTLQGDGEENVVTRPDTEKYATLCRFCVNGDNNYNVKYKES